MSGWWSVPGLPDEVAARLAWSRVAEPGDEVAGGLVAALGPVEALEWARRAAGSARPSRAPGPVPTDGLTDPVPADGFAGPVLADGFLGSGSVDDGLPGAVPAGGLSSSARRRLGLAVARWAPRLARLDVAADLAAARAVGARPLVPGDPGWPVRLTDLGAAAPVALWVRGGADLAGLLGGRPVAVVGARACTSYGERVAAELGAGLAERGVTVVSGGAYGIDAAVHRGAMAAGGAVVALLAGGIDRPGPEGNRRLLEATTATGALLAEPPPGTVPARQRFLLRNRLIAALGAASVVVEAAWRSGALSTARHAAALLRPVGAVPGPVTSLASAGCHRLLRDGVAVCVTGVAEVLELVAGAGDGLVPDPVVPERDDDAADPRERAVADALSRVPHGTEEVARSAGLAVGETLAALGRLELAGVARRGPHGWRRG